ncbi:hypothetical protein FHS97_000967 [Sphingomonas endophytica]|uniref:Uncharacterized protein n=1 Tax=Sphingomonas endophytica TaxID=869719 RepID=A0ABR6N2N8_9SPHN|nr:hypothetical protein [Sphingomonas endophytica]MBB5725059.1 hypothetical protein [Sphingomonas endophytica]
MTPAGHIVSVVSIWTMMLYGIRFAVAAGHWLVPAAAALWHLARCRGDRRSCRARFRATIDQLHADLVSAIKTPWSATLFFLGCTLIGGAYAFGAVGDAVRLVSVRPDAWSGFDIATDRLAAILSVTGMAFVMAAFSQHRTASFLVSGVLVATGLGIAVVTL